MQYDKYFYYNSDLFMCVYFTSQILFHAVSHAFRTVLKSMVTRLCFRNEIWFDDVDEILLEDVTKSKDPLLKKNAVTQ